MPLYIYLCAPTEATPRLRSPAGRDLPENSFQAFRFCVRVDLLCVLMHVLGCRFGRRTFYFRLVLALYLGREDLFAAVHTGKLINVVRKAEIAAFLILHDIHFIERVM